MKTSVIFMSLCLVALSVYMVWARFEDNDHGVSISVNDDTGTYKFSASYYKADTRKVEDFINSSISPNSLGKSESDYVDAITTLADKTQFHIKESAGRLKIEFDKRRNSTNSYYRIKKMCEGVKELLAGK